MRRCFTFTDRDEQIFQAYCEREGYDPQKQQTQAIRAMTRDADMVSKRRHSIDLEVSA